MSKYWKNLDAYARAVTDPKQRPYTLIGAVVGLIVAVVALLLGFEPGS